MLASTADGFTSSESTIMEKMVINGAAPHLPGEIIRNILKRLPVKSLMRFQCVCKHWKSLLKPHLSSKIISATPLTKILILLSDRTREMILSTYCRSIARCNSVSLSMHLWSVPCGAFASSVPAMACSASPIGITIFHPLYCGIRRLERIVRVSMNPGVCGVEVYSLSTESWRNIQFDNIKDVCTVNYGVTANGVMFWPGSKRMGADIIHVIVSLDLATEVFKVIPWPDFGLYPRTLAVYEDKLAIISHPKNRKTQDSYFSKWKMWDYSSVYFWVMEEEAIGSSGQRWSSSEKYMGNIRLYDGTFWRNQIVCIELGQGEDKERLYMIDVIANECKLFDIPRPKNGFGIHVFNYVESLVSVSGNIQIEEP